MAGGRDLSRMMRQMVHKKQERSQTIQEGEPRLADLVEGVPEFRNVTEKGVVQYVRYKDQIYSIPMQSEVKLEDKYPKGSTLTSPGWDKSESGLIIQWGTKDSTGTPVTIYFPVKFDNACFAVVANSKVETAVGSSNYNIAVLTYDYAKSNFKARVLGGAGTDYGATNDGFVWIAIGY